MASNPTNHQRTYKEREREKPKSLCRELLRHIYEFFSRPSTIGTNQFISHPIDVASTAPIRTRSRITIESPVRRPRRNTAPNQIPLKGSSSSQKDQSQSRKGSSHSRKKSSHSQKNSSQSQHKRSRGPTIAIVPPSPTASESSFGCVDAVQGHQPHRPVSSDGAETILRPKQQLPLGMFTMSSRQTDSQLLSKNTELCRMCNLRPPRAVHHKHCKKCHILRGEERHQSKLQAHAYGKNICIQCNETPTAHSSKLCSTCRWPTPRHGPPDEHSYRGKLYQIHESLELDSCHSGQVRPAPADDTRCPHYLSPLDKSPADRQSCFTISDYLYSRDSVPPDIPVLDVRSSVYTTDEEGLQHHAPTSWIEQEAQPRTSDVAKELSQEYQNELDAKSIGRASAWTPMSAPVNLQL